MMSKAFKMENIIVSTPEKLESGLESLYMSIMRDNEVSGIKCVVGLGFIRMKDGVSIDGLKFATAQKTLWMDLGGITTQKSLPRALCRFLNLPELTFVGVQIKHSLDTLYESYGFKFDNVIDLRSLAADVEGDKRLESYGLFDLALRLCNIRVKPELLEGHVKGALFARDRDEANVRITYTNAGFANVGTIDVHLAFMIGNHLLGGAMPYNMVRYYHAKA